MSTGDQKNTLESQSADERIRILEMKVKVLSKTLADVVQTLNVISSEKMPYLSPRVTLSFAVATYVALGHPVPKWIIEEISKFVESEKSDKSTDSITAS